MAVPIAVAGIQAASAAAPDGSGAVTVSPTYTVNSSTGNFYTFTYTAAAGGMTNGELALVVPTGWSAPVTDGFAIGGSNALCGDFSPTVTGSGPWTLHIHAVTLPAGATCDIHYGIGLGFGTVNAPSATGNYVFTVQQQSTAGGVLTALASSPSILVDTDGTGTMSVNPASALVSSTGNTHTFTYTATRALSNGELTVQVPGTWSLPSTTGSAPGFTTSTCGTVGTVTNTIDVTGVTLANGTSCTITYGSKTSGGPGATAPSTGGTQTFVVQHQSNVAHSNLQAIPVSPAISVVAADGSGTVTVTPNTAITSSSGNFFTFTYTAANGGMTHGELSLLVPAGWSAPVTDGFAVGATNALCGDFSPTITGSGPWTVHIHDVTIAGGATCDLHFGISGFGTVNAPSSPGNYVFTMQQKSFSTGVMTNLAGQPAIFVGDDGTGTLTVAPQSTLVSSTGNTLVFSYTAARTITAGTLTLAVPAGWSAPSTTGSNPGFITTTCAGGAVAAVASSIQINGFNLANGATCTITYGSTASGGAGANAPATGGTNTFATKQKSSAGGVLTDLATGSPQVFVVAPDGTGTVTVTPNVAITSSTGNFFTFTYTAANGGMHNGELALVVPAGWSAPVTDGFAIGGSNALCGDFSPTVTGSGPWTLHIHAVTLAGGATCDIHYGIGLGFGTVNAPSVTGLYDFTVRQQSIETGTLTDLAASPQILVGTDGTGTMSAAPTSLLAGSPGNVLTFTYTSATTMTNGEIDIVVPAGWTPPSTTAGADGLTDSTCGTVAVAGPTITVTGVNRTAGQTCTVTYGSTSGGATGVHAPAVGGTFTFTTAQKSSVGGTLTELLTSPDVSVVAADGSGTMTVSPTIVVPGSVGNALTFTYTAPAGSLHGGEITLEIPADWTAPNPDGFQPGGTNATCGDFPVTVSGSGPWLVHVTNVTLAGGATCDIHYGISGFGTVTAPAAAGVAMFPVREQSSAAGTLTDLAGTPQVTVGTDGGGTLTVAPTTTSASSGGNTLTFTFTAPVGGLSAGEVDVAVPAGWSTPSVTGSAPGFTTTTCPGGSVSVVGGTIEVTGINLAAAATCTVVYGSTASGGAGATAPAATGLSTFATQERSTAAGTLTALSTGSPQVTVYAADGSGTLTVSPLTADIGSSGNTFVFTYTAAAGGTTSGQLTIAVPAGWTPPSTTGSNAGFTQTTCGSVAIVAGAIQVSGINLAGAGTCTITYGSTTSGGAGATAPVVAGVSTFSSQQKATGGGSLSALVASPQVTVVAGSVKLDTAAVTVTEGASGATTSAGLHVVLGAVSAVDVKVHLAVTGGSATAGTDTSMLDMDITIPTGQTSATIPFDVLGDDVVEGDETAQITLTAISGATAVAPTVATVTITNDDTATLTVTGSDVVNNAASIVEGGGLTAPTQSFNGLVQANPVSGLTLSLDHPSANDITVTVATVDGTATAPGDYTPLNNQVFTILAGQTSLSIPLHANSDGVDEPSETFSVHFVSASGAVLDAQDITITILDIDPTVAPPTTPTTTPTTPTTPTPGAAPLPATGGSPGVPLALATALLVMGGMLTRIRRRPARA